ncbi:16S rRNA (guanine(966)-N(2))-methyltransferase RsmD [Basilea psittacipulmonis]|uniref:Methyltransferase n=1 Tax=Basilea psittacipulmonis DSM 24701 TaxID=1072685 RepID=A0A077DH33_9BURK|nr:16S rRNA (guanine(966)-N(2))-methyltransferase RsmD [Basilea psittacipulmonis]AIL32483.1 methyltransferase [Basilea psittacipulmonis DSM 24701]
MSKYSIRIIGGSCKRSNIPVAEVPGLRPTPNRVRETLFNWLEHLWHHQFQDKSILDLFAGSGALGFEAASRGAFHVQMVENHPVALSNLRQVRDKLKLSQVRIHNHDAYLVLSRMDASRFDLVLLDPPFNEGHIEKVMPYMNGILKPDGLIYIESEHRVTLDDNYLMIREGKAGQVYYQLFQRQS